MFQQFRRLCKNINPKSSIYSKGLRSRNVNTILVEKDENITLIGINREESRNSLNSTALKELNEAIRTFEDDFTSPVAVLYGIGGSFSAGYDIREMKDSDLWMNSGNAITRRHLSKPIVCGISGFCVGSGLEIALLCDLRVMEDTAVLGFFNRTFGVPLVDGGTARLARIIGFSRALEIIATGRRVCAKEAFEIGLINRIVATGTSLGQAVNLAISIAKFTQKAIHHDRECVFRSVYERRKFYETLQDEVMLISEDVISEMESGLRKFLKSESKGLELDSFNIQDKEIPNWERQEIEIEKECAKRKLCHLNNKDSR